MTDGRLTAPVEAFVAGRSSVAVAYSGGRDSTALLHATVAMAGRLGVRVVALHVHHGLSRHADEWLAHCTAQCERWSAAGAPIDLLSRRVSVDPTGRGVEAAARTARYGALAGMARDAGCDLLLLGHHRDDQAETVLLQALRGAGMAGLSAMPGLIERDGMHWARPWLQCPRTEIDAYVSGHGLAHIDDDSNTDPRYARNRLRREVWPTFGASFPQASQALVAVATHAQEAAACLEDLAVLDLQTMRRGTALSRSAWLRLPVHRRANALRHWLAEMIGAPVPASLMHRLLDELGGERPARWPLDAGRHVCLYRDTISADGRPGSSVRPRLDIASSAVVDASPGQDLCITAPGSYRVGAWQGVLHVDRVDGAASGAVALSDLSRLQARRRKGGEQFQRAHNTPPRSLKKQYQWAGVPAWQRDGPLLWCGGRLLFVPGLGIDARWCDRPASPTPEPCCTLRWIPGDDGADEGADEMPAI